MRHPLTTRPAGASTPADGTRHTAKAAGGNCTPCQQRVLRSLPAGRARLLLIALTGYLMLQAPWLIDDHALIDATQWLFGAAVLVHGFGCVCEEIRAAYPPQVEVGEITVTTPSTYPTTKRTHA